MPPITCQDLFEKRQQGKDLHSRRFGEKKTVLGLTDEGPSPDIQTGDIAHSQQTFLSRSDSHACNVRMLRHSAASVLIFGGLDVTSTAKRLGHSRTSTTLDVYAHLIQDAEQKSADILGEAFMKHA